MSFYLADANGYIRDIASIGGWRGFIEWAPDDGPIRDFIEQGETHDPESLATALSMEQADRLATDSIRRDLIEAARAADEILILSDGETSDETASVEAEADWNEADHPRADDGKFSESPGGGGSSEGEGKDYKFVPRVGDGASPSQLGYGAGNAEYDRQYEALSNYKAYGSMAINGGLRDGSIDGSDPRVSAIESAITKTDERDVHFYRGDGGAIASVMFETADIPSLEGITAENLKSAGARAALRDLDEEMQGRVFTDKGFTSTSSDSGTAFGSFVAGSRSLGDKEVSGFVEIVGRTKALDMDKFMNEDGGESEQLLPRGTKYKIKSVKARVHQDDHSLIYLHWKVEIVR